MDISTEFVLPGYKMDPETEVLLPDGTALENGMVVLLDQHWDSVALENYRWCRIESFAYSKGWVSFVGVYGDGLKMSRCIDSREAWIAKKDSDIPETTKGDRKRAAVLALVGEAVSEENRHIFSITAQPEPPNLEEYTDKIMALFEEKS